MDERLTRAESTAERAVEEGRTNRDQFRALQEDRKRDVEETAEFIKQIIAASKQDWQGAVSRVVSEVESIKHELHSSVASEVARLTVAMDSKVDLREVQQALNDCQSDIREQLSDFRATVTTDHKQAEQDVRKLIEKKANLAELHELLNLKADARDTLSRLEHQEAAFKLEALQAEVHRKLDCQGKVPFSRIRDLNILWF